MAGARPPALLWRAARDVRGRVLCVRGVGGLRVRHRGPSRARGLVDRLVSAADPGVVPMRAWRTIGHCALPRCRKRLTARAHPVTLQVWGERLRFCSVEHACELLDGPGEAADSQSFIGFGGSEAASRAGRAVLL